MDHLHRRAAYVGTALVIGVLWPQSPKVAGNVRWAIEAMNQPSTITGHILAPLRLTRVLMILWGSARRCSAALQVGGCPVHTEGVAGHHVPAGIVVSASCHLFTELHCGRSPPSAWNSDPRHAGLRPASWGGRCWPWALGSGVPVLGIFLRRPAHPRLNDLTPTQFHGRGDDPPCSRWCSGFIPDGFWRGLPRHRFIVVRAALQRVEAVSNTNLVVFDGTELGQLRRASTPWCRDCAGNVRDLFGRHVGREVALAAESRQIGAPVAKNAMLPSFSLTS